ncbi:BglG family transcription antiterminator [Lachnospiraceae bacterium 54-53]
MIDYKLEVLLQEMSAEEYRTSSYIAGKLNVNEKTVQSRVKELNELLKGQGAVIHSKRRFGYKLMIQDKEQYETFRNCPEDQNKEYLPSSSAERVPYILSYLLNHSEYIKLEALSEFLYISRNTLTADLKKVDYILNIYHLTLERRPNYGILVKGKEFDKRVCMANSLVKGNTLFQKNVKKQHEFQMIGEILLGIMSGCRMRISEISFESLIIHVSIAVGRIRRGYFISMDPDKTKNMVGEEVFLAAEEAAKALEERLKVSYGEDEVCYLAIHLGAKLSSDSYGTYGPNFVISSEIDELVLRMLKTVYNGFRMDFRNNLELRMSLNQHMVPFDIRMQYRIPLENPLIREIKKECAFAYTVAATACTVLNEHYKINIPEDEIGYFAILFALALEKQKRKIEKKNIVMVCMSGKGSSQLFIYKYRQAFGKYMNDIYECPVYDLADFDFKGKKIDYVFTTVPINIKVPVPVFEVNPFPELKDIVIYSELFEKGSNEFIYKYYKKELFLSGLTGRNKEEIIGNLCDYIGKYYDLPETFYESVMKREASGRTDFGNLTAIPHPYRVLTKENFVAVGILEKPVWWGNNEVQAVFLISISTEEDEDVECFYRLTTNLIFDAPKMQYLIHNPAFEVLISLLTESGHPGKDDEI